MKAIYWNILAIIVGFLVGNLVNMLLISLSPSLIPPPSGTDISTAEGLSAAIPLFEPKHFIMPFLAHALGTFTGAFLAAKIAATHKMKFAYTIGFFFLLGGIAAAFMIPAPAWFIALDLLLAYIPMAHFAGKLTRP